MTLHRLTPIGPVQAYRTYAAKLATRPASCAEVDCPAYLNGWVTRVPAGSDMDQYIRSGAHGRRYAETTGLDRPEVEFRFYPGQPCFRASQHRAPIERLPLLLARDGDWRGNPSGRSRTHTRVEDWIEDYTENATHFEERRRRG